MECPCSSWQEEGPNCTGCRKYYNCGYCKVDFCESAYGRHDASGCRRSRMPTVHVVAHPPSPDAPPPPARPLEANVQSIAGDSSGPRTAELSPIYGNEASQTIRQPPIPAGPAEVSAGQRHQQYHPQHQHQQTQASSSSGLSAGGAAPRPTLDDAEAFGFEEEPEPSQVPEQPYLEDQPEEVGPPSQASTAVHEPQPTLKRYRVSRKMSQEEANDIRAELAAGRQRAEKRAAENQSEARRLVKQHRFDTDALWNQHLSRQARQEPRLPALSEFGSRTAPAYEKLHSTHVLMRLKSIVFCRVCGYWMQERPQCLARACKGRPVRSDDKSRLKKPPNGRHLERKVECWPDGTSTSLAV